jgi:hypothetical protein
MKREQKITLGETRESGPTRLIIYCGDYKCAHSTVIDAEQWGHDVRLSDLEPRFVCPACGHRGADFRPLFDQARMAQAHNTETRRVELGGSPHSRGSGAAFRD